MQPEEKSVEGALLDCGDDWITEPIKGLQLYFAAWPRRRAEHMMDTPAMRSAGVEEAGQLRIHLPTLGDRVCTHQHIPISKSLFIRFLKTERIGFMRHFGS
jgi:hypothetical protein